MKALIIIDIEDKAFEYYSKQNPKALTVDLMDHVGESRGFYRPKFLLMKPMPQKKYDGKEWTKHYDVAGDYLKAQGYNQCLDEITGETE